MRDITLAEEKWLRTKAMPNYLIYSKADEPVYCLNCKSEFDSRKLTTRRIGKEVKCPCCGEKGKIKNKKSTAYWECGTAIIPDREDDHLILRYFAISRNFNPGWREYELIFTECFREEYDFKGNIYVSDKRWNDKFWRDCKIEYGYYRISTYTNRPLGTHVNLSSDNVSIYPNNITRYLKGTPMERIQMYKIFKHIKLDSRYDVYCIFIDALGGYADYFEYIFKVGMDNLAYELVTHNPYKRVKKEEKSLIKMWSLTKETYRELLQLGEKATLTDLNRFQKYTEFNLMTPRDREVFDKYIDGKSYRTEDLLKVLPVSLNKFGRWAETHQPLDLSLYIDYLRMCKELGLDMKNTFVSLPKDLKTAHDMVVDMYNELQFDMKLKRYADEANEFKSDYEKIVAKKEDLFSYADDSMQIIVPKTTREIGHEGYKLRHCVAQYMSDIVADKKTILFLRNKAELDVPFFTMEIIGKKITQCKGYRNCPRPAEVEKFLKGFAKAKHLSIAKDEHFAAVM